MYPMTDTDLAILLQQGTIFKVHLVLQLLMGFANTVHANTVLYTPAFYKYPFQEHSHKHPACQKLS